MSNQSSETVDKWPGTCMVTPLIEAPELRKLQYCSVKDPSLLQEPLQPSSSYQTIDCLETPYWFRINREADQE